MYRERVKCPKCGRMIAVTCRSRQFVRHMDGKVVCQGVGVVAPEKQE